MGYYCTVPQCTSLAGKTKNVKFHRFPRDLSMADKWNSILKRGKPYTKYSKVCSLHFTQADYNVTTMGKNKGILGFSASANNINNISFADDSFVSYKFIYFVSQKGSTAFKLAINHTFCFAILLVQEEHNHCFFLLFCIILADNEK